ncbi:Hydroxypyruvate reductase [Paenibacillus solanacearum]|uniref:Hydroxypyruvate reductase n=1 Tax=Paenibacillus solanacearum TaxID=2048548 RepID=A0A916JVL8_9BACL|nr:hydroxyacid dehydrogenase [Paenibacillus solanacearum]CAG7608122.1 Hydroxypyruvate reductase [Paenibacillus solanacearum]
MRILITVWKKELKDLFFGEEVQTKLRDHFEVDWVPEGVRYEETQLEREISRYDAVLTSWGSPKITANVLSQAANLKFIGHAGGTLIPYVDPDVFQRNIKVVNANTALAKSTAELAIALMLAGAWNICGYRDELRSGIWGGNGGTVSGLYGQSVGLIGIGEVAREVIALLRPFHTKIRLCSPYCTPDEAEQLGVQLCGLDELLRESSIVSLHDTLTPETRGMLGKEELRKLQTGALLVNTARAALIDEEALYNELASGRIRAALDVYYREPLSGDDPFLRLPNVVCMPHIGAFSAYWKSQLAAMVIDELLRFTSGAPLLREITLERFLRMTSH